MDISDLHYFTAAADAGSFSSSGKALGRDPSTLSRRIEPDIGDEVHRLPVRYSLTGGSPAGAMRAHKGRKRSIRLDGRRTALGRHLPVGDTGPDRLNWVGSGSSTGAGRPPIPHYSMTSSAR